MTCSDERRLRMAEGYLELDLHGPALGELANVSGPLRSEFNWLNLSAEANRGLGRYEEALEHLAGAQRIRPEEIGVYISMGWCYKRTDRLGRAIEALTDAERRCRRKGNDSHHGLVMYNLSCYHALAKRVEDSAYWLSKAIEADSAFARLVPEERDFDSVRDSSIFQQALAVATADGSQSS